jgi:hypothetical protein
MRSHPRNKIIDDICTQKPCVYHDLFTGKEIVLGETKKQKEKRKAKDMLSGHSHF